MPIWSLTGELRPYMQWSNQAHAAATEPACSRVCVPQLESLGVPATEAYMLWSPHTAHTPQVESPSPQQKIRMMQWRFHVLQLRPDIAKTNKLNKQFKKRQREREKILDLGWPSFLNDMPTYWLISFCHRLVGIRNLRSGKMWVGMWQLFLKVNSNVGSEWK